MKLAGTSGVFYAFVRAHLVQQFEQELRSAFNALVAAVEVEPQDVSWQPLEHTIAQGSVQEPDRVFWAVIGDGRRIVEKSPNATPEFMAQAQAMATRDSAKVDNGQAVTQESWQMLHQRLVAPAPDYRNRDLDEFDTIDVVVARSTAPLNSNLRRLLLLVGALPWAIWILAAAVGHGFCRRALKPLWDMSEQVHLLRDETAQLQAIVESLLFLARSEEDAILPDTETFSLAAWLPEYLSRWKEHPRHRDIGLTIGPTGVSQIKPSKVLLARLLDNLIENAWKYSPSGSRVDVIATTDHDGVLLEVQDQGRGIAPGDQAKIFNAFFRSRAARDDGIAGIGLGLAIAARIAAALGGRLGCTSQAGQGSRFTLWLPTVSSGSRTHV